jgi:cephalosporin-C deacetylase-like acetyl esterase
MNKKLKLKTYMEENGYPKNFAKTWRESFPIPVDIQNPTNMEIRDFALPYRVFSSIEN